MKVNRLRRKVAKTSALGEKIAALEAVEHLEARAARGSRAKFRKALARVPDVEPEPNDRLD